MRCGDRDSPQHRRHVQPDRAAPAQCGEAADNQVAKESEAREDRERDDEVIHR
jgi:hypothetical protein